jgi:hypothetical protein
LRVFEFERQKFLDSMETARALFSARTGKAHHTMMEARIQEARDERNK